jgi:hypothetical protein
MKIPSLFLLFIFTTSSLFSQSQITGIVKDMESGELLVGANVFLRENKRGGVTNLNGYFSIQTPEGSYTLVCQYIGYKPFTKTITIKKDEKKYSIIPMHPDNIEGETITVTAFKDKAQTRIETSVIDVRPAEVKKLQDAFEDVFRSVATLTGVISTSETIGLSVVF